MAAHRHWRIVGLVLRGAGPLELSEIELYASGAKVGGTIVPSCPFIPSSGALADLADSSVAGAVAWESPTHTSAGFYLAWDLTGAGDDVDGIKLGSGSSRWAFPLKLIVQYSDDAANWVTGFSLANFNYPGDAALSPLLVNSALPINTVLGVPFVGNNASTTFFDASSPPKSLTAHGTAKISTLQSKFGGSSLLLNGSSDYVTTPYSSDFDLPEDFTISAWVCFTGYSDSYGIAGYGGAIATRYLAGASPDAGWQFRINGTASSYNSINIYTGRTDLNFGGFTIPLNTFTHVEVTRQGSSIRAFVNGVQAGSTATNADPFTRSGNNELRIGGLDDAGFKFYFRGHINDLLIVKGAALHTANFTPPTQPLVGVDGVYGTRLPLNLPTVISAGSLPHGAARLLEDGATFFDVYNGGLGAILGTVKEKNLPVNTPLHRRVLLLDQRSQQVIRETWSDDDGSYMFYGIRDDIRYTIICYDYTGTYRAVIIDNVIPELI